jgi:hypothetical protein
MRARTSRIGAKATEGESETTEVGLVTAEVTEEE